MQPELGATQAIQNSPLAMAQAWFDYPIRVHPHHTDYAGVVWHGAYIAWMEEARIECLRALGVDYGDIVAMGCELPVVELSIRYHRVMRFGTTAIVKTRLAQMEGVRVIWDYQIKSRDEQELYVTAKVTLVAIDRDKGKIMRQLPTEVQKALAQLIPSS